MKTHKQCVPMVLYCLIIQILVASTVQAGVKEGGGGDGYVASFKAAAIQVADLLKIRGKDLNPPVDPNQFLMAVEPNKILSVGPLQPGDSPVTFNGVVVPWPVVYKGLPRDCYYYADLDLIAMDRSRWDQLQENGPEMLRGVAHEIFRRMGLEGDGYEISSQLIDAAPPACELSFSTSADAGMKCQTNSGAILERVESGSAHAMAWKDPDGHIWTDISKSSRTQAEAVEACAAIQGYLPSESDYSRAIDFGFLNLWGLDVVWTSTHDPSNCAIETGNTGNDGMVFPQGMGLNGIGCYEPANYLPIRCIVFN